MMLEWYDRHARTLPWRVSPADRMAGKSPDPYRVWLSEVMLQQTTVPAVGRYYRRFTELWPTVTALAAAPDADVMAEWAGLGYYARARNLLKSARVVAERHGGAFPADHDTLLALPGIGPYTAAAVSAIAFDLPETVMDANVERVIARLADIRDPLPGAKPLLKARAMGLTPVNRPGDYAQAMMDLGATICTPRNPACGICPLRPDCIGHAAGSAPDLPQKTPKKAKPTRFGTAWIARREDGAWLLETRPDKGLLGGMLGWPGTEWSETAPTATNPPANGNWRKVKGEVRHTFTHFHLRLTVLRADLPQSTSPERGEFVDPIRFRPASLPTVMRKAFDLARSS